MTEEQILNEAEKIKSQRRSRKRYKQKKKRGLTDKISILIAILTISAFIYAAVLMWHTRDTSALPQFIISSAGFGTIVLTAAISKNAYEKKLQFGPQESFLNDDRYNENEGDRYGN